MISREALSKLKRLKVKKQALRDRKRLLERINKLSLGQQDSAASSGKL